MTEKITEWQQTQAWNLQCIDKIKDALMNILETEDCDLCKEMWKLLNELWKVLKLNMSDLDDDPRLKIIATLKDVVNGSEFASWLDKKKEDKNYQDTIIFVERIISFFRLIWETWECTKLNSVLNSHIRKLDPNERLKWIIDL